MANPLHLDDRLPDLIEIVDATRQQRRRTEHRPTPCSRCRQPVVPEDICLANGKDTHRSCAEWFNYSIIEGYGELLTQDAETMTLDLSGVHPAPSPPSAGMTADKAAPLVQKRIG